MAQTGFTPIQIYRSSTASAAPTSGNLVAGELAINTADGKLFYLDNLNAVQVIAWKSIPVTVINATGTPSSTTFLRGDGSWATPSTVAGSVVVGTTAITSGTSGRILYDNAGTLGELATTGTGSVVRNTNPAFATDIEIRPFSSKFIGLGGGNELTNTVFGAYALSSNSFGYNNIAIGDYALNQSLNGYGSIAIGNNAGSTITTGENNIYIGDNVAAFNSSAVNEIVIGFGAIGNGSNKTVIGNSSTTSTTLYGSLQAIGDATTNSNIYTSQTTGNLTIGGASATGSTTLNGNVKLATKASLPTASAGLVEYDGSAFYNSVAASTRGVMPSEQFVILNAPYTLASQTAAQQLFNNTTNGAVTLPIGTYQFECQFSLTSLSSLGTTIGFALVAGTAVIGSQAWTSVSSKPATLSSGLSNAQLYFNTAANTILSTANANTNAIAIIRGIVKITTAGTIIPSTSMSVAAAAIVSVNSYFKISPVSGTSAANITIGNWS
jgi:hypothetical protein